MPDTNGGVHSTPKYSIVVTEATGEVLGNMNLVTGYYLAELHRLIEKNKLDKELDPILDRIKAKIEQDPMFNGGHRKDLNVLRIYREHCRGKDGDAATVAQPPVPAPQPPPVATSPIPPTAGPPVPPTLADALKSKQAEASYRRWANDVGEDLVKERLLYMAAHPEKSHPPALEILTLPDGTNILLAPSATRFVSGQLLTVSYAINGEIPKGRRSKDLLMDGDGNPFIRSLQSPAAGLGVGESVWMRVLRANEGSKLRYWVHHEDLDADLEEMYLYYVIHGGRIVQLSPEEWRG